MSKAQYRLPQSRITYVGTNPEVGGTTPFQLLSSNHPTQMLSPAGPITVKLPTTGILTGDTWQIYNTTTNTITIQSSDGTVLVALGQGNVSFTALQNTPTGTAHWKNLLSISLASSTGVGLVSAEDSGTFTAGFGGAISLTNVTVKYSRIGKSVTITLPEVIANTNSSNTISTNNDVPASLRPASNLYFPITAKDTTVQANPGYIVFGSDDSITIGKTRASPNFTNGVSAGMSGDMGFSWSR